MDNRIIDVNTYGFILNTIKSLNLDKDEQLLKLYIDKIIQEIVIKTNRTKFPTDLKYLVVDLLNDMISINNSPEQLQSVQSMSEQDRSVNFGVDNISQTKFNLLLQQKLEDNEKLISRYKLLYKVGGNNAEN